MKRLNDVIFESHINPFGVLTYIPGQTVTDFVGRADELEIMKQEIYGVFQYQLSKAIRIEGPGGVGKSTLFNYLKESIEKERSERQPNTRYILQDTDIFSTYFSVPSKIAEFAEIWKPMMEGLIAGFEAETDIPLTLPEYVVFHLVYKMFCLNPDQMADVIWGKTQRPPNLNLVSFKEIIEPLLSQGPMAVKILREYYTVWKGELRNQLKHEINGISYKIDRNDNDKIMNLFRVIDEDDPDHYLESIKEGTADFLNSNEKIIGYFNDLMRYYCCATGKRPLLLIGIDEFAKADPIIKEDYYKQLSNLLIRLRNDLKYILFVLISTTEDWAQFDEVIGHTDTKSQLSGFIKTVQINQLSIDDVCLVFQNRMNRFWENYSSDRSTTALYYPFSKLSFEYVYRYESRNLRNSLQFFKDIWMWVRSKRLIPKMETSFETMAAIRQYKNIELDVLNLQPHDWNIIRDTYCSQPEFTNNAKRSSMIENALEMLFQCLKLEEPTKITKVENNPSIKTISGTRRPDIYVQILGNLGAEYRRQIEFQVKAYVENSYVELKHIESSIILFEENHTDLIYFLITGKGLSPEAEKRVKEIENKYTNRIIRPPLNERQINYMYLLGLFKEIAGYPLGSKPSDVKLAKTIFNGIFNRTFEQFIQEVEKLSFRKVEGKIESEGERNGVKSYGIGVQDAGTIGSTSQSSSELQGVGIEFQGRGTIDKFVGSSIIHPPEIPTGGNGKGTINGEKGDEIQSADNILDEKYPYLKPYHNELFALFGFLCGRETGRYRFQFTNSTVLNNVIQTNASLSKFNFTNLVKTMQTKLLLESSKSSYILTKQGEILYWEIKKAGNVC